MDLRLPTLTQPGASNGVAEAEPRYCLNRDLHKLFNIPGQKNLCPLKTLPDKNKFKERAKWGIVNQKRADSLKDIQELRLQAR